MRVLAIDFGEKKIGLATSDATAILATPRDSIDRRDDIRAIEEILQFCSREEISLMVVGLPRSPEGVESPFAARIRSFASKLRAATSLPVEFHEETLTSNEAARRIAGGTSARRRARATALDPMAAAVLLEDYLAQKAGEPG